MIPSDSALIFFDPSSGTIDSGFSSFYTNLNTRHSKRSVNESIYHHAQGMIFLPVKSILSLQGINNINDPVSLFGKHLREIKINSIIASISYGGSTIFLADMIRNASMSLARTENSTINRPWAIVALCCFCIAFGIMTRLSILEFKYQNNQIRPLKFLLETLKTMSEFPCTSQQLHNEFNNRSRNESLSKHNRMIYSILSYLSNSTNMNFTEESQNDLVTFVWMKENAITKICEDLNHPNPQIGANLHL